MSDLINRGLPPITTGRPTPPKPPGIQGPATESTSFRELLRQSIPQQPQTRELTFSKHAQARVAQRGVEVSPEDMLRLEGAISLAQEKGIKDSLVFLDGRAFVVNIPSKVIVTVVDNESSRENVFTNIDGAVIL